MLTIDLNADLGEGLPNDEAILRLVTSTSIACGGHAGDLRTMEATLIAAKSERVLVGAHPGYADREAFGRADRSLDAGQVCRLILDQWEVLDGVAEKVGVLLGFLKPHGALYNQAQRSEPHADGVVQAALRLDRPILGMPGGLVELRAKSLGVRFVAEGFPDRRYRPNGSLMPRSDPGAELLDPDEVANQAVTLAARGIQTLCIHGDNPNAAEFAAAIRRALGEAGIEVRSGF